MMMMMMFYICVYISEYWRKTEQARKNNQSSNGIEETVMDRPLSFIISHAL